MQVAIRVRDEDGKTMVYIELPGTNPGTGIRIAPKEIWHPEPYDTNNLPGLFGVVNECGLRREDHPDGFMHRVHMAMDAAMQEAKNGNERFIGTQHILLGLLKDNDAVATHVLRRLGVTEATFRQALEWEITPE